MTRFKTWLEHKDFMAKGVNMQSNLPLARHIVGLSVVDGYNSDQISKDPEVQRSGGLPSAGSISRVLRNYGLTANVSSQMRKARAGSEEKSQIQYDVYHNRNKFGKNPERDYVPKHHNDPPTDNGDEWESTPIPSHISKNYAAPPGQMKVRLPDGNIVLRPLNYEVGSGETVVKGRRKQYGVPQSQPDVRQVRKPQVSQPFNVPKNKAKVPSQYPFGNDDLLDVA